MVESSIIIASFSLTISVASLILKDPINFLWVRWWDRKVGNGSSLPPTPLDVELESGRGVLAPSEDCFGRVVPTTGLDFHSLESQIWG